MSQCKSSLIFLTQCLGCPYLKQPSMFCFLECRLHVLYAKYFFFMVKNDLTFHKTHKKDIPKLSVLKREKHNATCERKAHDLHMNTCVSEADMHRRLAYSDREG